MTQTVEAGLDIDVTIDGTPVVLPSTFEPRNILRQSLQETYNGMYRQDVPYDGDGLPDQPDRFEFGFDWGLDDTLSATVAFLEQLRTAGGVHAFAFWKKLRYRYTARSGQNFIYLPRPDAFSKGYANHSDTTKDKPVVKVNNSALIVDTGSNVTSGTSVTAGHVAISNSPVAHPESGKTVAYSKFGTALTGGDIVDVEYHPLFNTVVRELASKPFQIVGREDKALFLVEVN